MARIIVMPDASHLRFGIQGTVLYAEQVAPEHLDDLHCSELILERLERAVREAGRGRATINDVVPRVRASAARQEATVRKLARVRACVRVARRRTV